MKEKYSLSVLRVPCGLSERGMDFNMNENQKKEEIELEKISTLLKKAKTDDGTFYGALYDLYVFIGIVKGVNDIKHGNGIPLEKLKKEMKTLYGNTSRRFG